MWWEHWFDENMAKRIDSMVSRGIVKPEGGRLKLNVSMLTSPYWMHISGSLDSRNCALWYEVFHKELGIIHNFCRYHCWKCVSRPRNVRELIQMHNLMYVVPFVYNFINPIPGKAGLDVRRHTAKPYGTFQYAQSLAEALRIKEIMTYMIREYLPNEEIDGKHLQDTLIVKRSCTEFEQSVPGHDPWWDTPQTPDEVEIERRIEDMFVNDLQITMQPAWLKDKVLNFWLHQANSIGDESAVDFMGKDLFNAHSRQYGPEDLRKGGDPESEALESAEEPNSKENKSWQ